MIVEGATTSFSKVIFLHHKENKANLYSKTAFQLSFEQDNRTIL